MHVYIPTRELRFFVEQQVSSPFHVWERCWKNSGLQVCLIATLYVVWSKDLVLSQKCAEVVLQGASLLGNGVGPVWCLDLSQTLLYLWHPLTLWLVWLVCTSGLSLLYHILVPDTAWSAYPTCARLFSLLRVAMAETPGTRGATRCCRCGRRAAGSSRPMTEGSSCGSIGTCWVQNHGMIGVAEVRVGALLEYPYWEILGAGKLQDI